MGKVSQKSSDLADLKKIILLCWEKLIGAKIRSRETSWEAGTVTYKRGQWLGQCISQWGGRPGESQQAFLRWSYNRSRCKREESRVILEFWGLSNSKNGIAIIEIRRKAFLNILFEMSIESKRSYLPSKHWLFASSRREVWVQKVIWKALM